MASAAQQDTDTRPSDFPVDFWVMDVPNASNLAAVENMATVLFGDAFEWLDGRGHPKGVMRQISEVEATHAERVLAALGARTAVDEDAYAEPGTWLSSITPAENRADAFAMVEEYLRDPRGRNGGQLRVVMQVSGEGMIRRLAHTWEPWNDLPPFPSWDEIV